MIKRGRAGTHVIFARTARALKKSDQNSTIRVLSEFRAARGYASDLTGLTIANRCLACRAQRGPLRVLPKAKRPRGNIFWSQYETI